MEMPRSAKVTKSADLSYIVEQPNALELIQALSPLAVYRALVAADPEVRLEAVDKLTTEQVTGIFDFDIWKEDRISPKNAFQWLKIFGEVGTEEYYNRFKNLEEEYQLALLGPYIRIYDQEEYERLTDGQQDRLTALPASEFYYEITAADPDVFEGIENLIESTMAHDMQYTISLLAHACFIPPAEQEQMAAQFRKARIEEEGFVSFDESQSSFFSLNIDDKISQWSHLAQRGAHGLVAEAADANKTGFLAKVLTFGHKSRWNSEEVDQLNAGFIFVANNLCAASQVETDDEQSLAMILHQVKSLSGLALEVLSEGDVTRAAEILLKEHPKTLFRTGISLINLSRERVLKTLEDAGLPEARSVSNLLSQGKFGQALETIEINWLDALGLQNLEVLKAFFNRYPLRPVALASDAKAKIRLSFAPIDSVAAMVNLHESLDACFGLVGLLASGSPFAKNRSLDSVINTAIVNVIVEDSFSCQPIGRNQLDRFCAIAIDDIENLSDKFLVALQVKLQENYDWSVHSATIKYLRFSSSDSVAGLIADLRRRIQGLVEIRSGLEFLSSKDLAALITIG
jgi:hypothetical protein